jgi:ribosomal protein S18 acetylase RimI-like enzyme
MNDLITVRIARADDAEDIAPLSNQLMDMHASKSVLFRTVPGYEKLKPDYIRAEIAKPNTKFFVAYHETKPVGFAMVSIMDRPSLFHVQRKGHIGTTCVAEECRGKGVGKILIDAVKEWFRSQDVTVIDLMVTQTNPKAHKFWKNQGFEDLNQHMVCEISRE